MAAKTKAKTGGDVFIHIPSQQANKFSVSLKTTALGGQQSLAQIAGAPVAVSAGVATLLASTGLGAATHLLMHGDAFTDVAQDTTLPGKYSAVGIAASGAGGNIVVNEDAIFAGGVDSEGTSWDNPTDATALKGALEALGFRFVKEPAEKTTQTT